jgi:16S rRNA (uracil1498-N3)-methyltransferase
MHRFFLPPRETQLEEFSLSGAEGHHAVRVLRIRKGARVMVLDGAGTELLCEVLETGRTEFYLRVLRRERVAPPPQRVTLIQAVPKGRLMEFIVQKATELGASCIVPVLSERTVPEWNETEGSAKQARWRTAAVEAIKQCGSPWLPEVQEPRSIAAVLRSGGLGEMNLMASLQPGALHPRERFQRFLADHGRLPQTVSVWVGPEGDYTPAELNMIQAAGAVPISLGRLVLRSETAALYCMAILQYELQAPR